MKKQFEIATVMVAILLLFVLMVPVVMSGNGNTTDLSKTNGHSTAKYAYERGRIISTTVSNETNISEAELSISIAATSDLVGKIAFTSDRAGVPGIFVMNADGSNVVPLTSEKGWFPAWSPDGKKIAFCSDAGISVMNANGSNVVPLTSDGGYGPAWSPDGKRIAFCSDGEIYLMNADGSNVVPLTSSTGYDEFPTWSPDGKKIAFEGGNGGDRICVMNADGSNVVQLTSDSGYCPAWSPDGKKIAFASWRNGGDEICVMNADGSDVVQLTSDSGFEPAWSPDGKKIAFDSSWDGNSEICVMNADGSNVVRLTINTALDCSPDGCSSQIWDPWIYDTNENGIIERYEASIAAKDYFEKKIIMEHALEVLLLHFATQPGIGD